MPRIASAKTDKSVVTPRIGEGRDLRRAPTADSCDTRPGRRQYAIPGMKEQEHQPHPAAESSAMARYLVPASSLVRKVILTHPIARNPGEDIRSHCGLVAFHRALPCPALPRHVPDVPESTEPRRTTRPPQPNRQSVAADNGRRANPSDETRTR
ncbi:uncharacterized protein UV8b_06797 [Ustilaginoidea virens]|uniref:Uncharacterized protein n=1 Tax=Ustilaginoidea virens TaxID=1159556 RepID=A0A8E5HVY1_USTVR|nr:uncharacterized protein UV8b_06797 [Ustilaginoidea virens]QUC22556.1 hypothetical protein UV8b_06797 [Ustilaginoidea virens]